MASATKDKGEILDWTALGDTATDNALSVETPDIVKSTELEVEVLVTVAHVDANDAASNYVTIKLMKKMGANLEDWRLHKEFQAGGGQATTEALDAESASGQPNIKVAATTDFDDGTGKRLILYNNGAIIASEMVTIIGWSDADYYIAAENLTNTHDSDDDLYDSVDEITVRIPMSIETSKLIITNNDDDANYLVRVDYTEVQAIG